jgi:hypothetical protein
MKRLNLSILDLLNPEKSWILVDKGIILGYFDWVPEKLKVGPWSPFAPAVLFSLVYMATWGRIISYRSIQFETEPSFYPQVDTTWWYYNLLACLWISWVSITVWFGPSLYHRFLSLGIGQVRSIRQIEEKTCMAGTLRVKFRMLFCMGK